MLKRKTNIIKKKIDGKRKIPKKKKAIIKTSSQERILIYDIFPPEKVKEISKQILGIKAYPTKRAKFFALSWRFAFASFLTFSLLTGFAPMRFLHSSLTKAIVGGEVKSINFYTTIASGWTKTENVLGSPNIFSDNTESFSEENSAVYNDGDEDLICEGFKDENIIDELEIINTEQKNETEVEIIITDSSTTEDIEPINMMSL